MAADSPDLVVLDWDAMQPGLRQAIASDMASAWFMYAVLIMLVAFSVLNTQLMSVLERTREFGVMLALGMRPAAGAAGGHGNPDDVGSGPCHGRVAGGATDLVPQLGRLSYPGMEEMGAKFNMPGRMYPEVSLLSLLWGPRAYFSVRCWQRCIRRCACSPAAGCRHEGGVMAVPLRVMALWPGVTCGVTTGAR